MKEQHLYEFLEMLVKENNDIFNKIKMYVNSEYIFRFCSLEVMVVYMEGFNKDKIEPIDIWQVIRSEDISKIKFMFDNFGEEIWTLFDKYTWLYKVFKRVDNPNIIQLTLKYKN